MACGCTKRSTLKYLWFKDEGTEPIPYDTEMQAKARVIRKGGRYIPYNPALPLAPQIAAAAASLGW